MEKKNDNFIMLPTVDICFKNLMENPEVRKGFIAALLRKNPENIKKTTLLPTILQKDYEEDKQGILDVLVQLEDGTQIDMEMQVAYYEYWEASGTSKRRRRYHILDAFPRREDQRGVQEYGGSE